MTPFMEWNLNCLRAIAELRTPLLDTLMQGVTELGGETLERYTRSAGLLESHDVSGIPTAAGSFDVGADDSNVGWSGVGQYDDLLNPCSLMMLMGAIAGDGSAAEPSLIYQETSMNGLTLFDGSSSARSSSAASSTCRPSPSEAA